MNTEHLHPHLNLAELSGRAVRRLALALVITLAFVIIEVLAGWWANSLALLTDAAHNLTDVIALALSWFAMRMTLRPANPGKTFGYHRAGILVAFVNSTTLALIAIWIFVEAYQRLVSPPEVKSLALVVVGSIAFLVNLFTALLIRRDSQHDLNLRSTFLHLMGDVFSTLGAVAAGVLIYFTGLNWIDPLVSVFIGALILWNAWIVLREAVSILLEGTPGDIDMSRMVRDLLNVKGVLGVHDLHVWSITSNLRALSAHILTDDITIGQGAMIQQEINQVLNQRYNIAHATLQLECANCEPNMLYCEIGESNHQPIGGSR
jgi:cobalt-zinc-cadmium efflux system protein